MSGTAVPDLSSPTIGFVGLGNMGFPMAGQLCARGFGLIVHDVDEDAARRFRAAHDCRIATSRRDLAEQVDVLILMLPDGKVVRDVLLSGQDGTEAPAPFLRPGAVVVDMSSSAPTGTRELGAALGDLGVILIDAPVSGGVPRARNGTLTVMVGGDEAAATRLRPVFDAMASAVLFVGALGAGHAMKALNNYVSAAGLVAACEAVMIAEKFGIDGRTAVQVLNASTGKNNSTEHKLVQHVLSRTFSSGFSLGLMHKDLAAALQLAADLRMDLPLAPDLVRIWEEAERTFGRNADHTEIARLVAD